MQFYGAVQTDGDDLLREPMLVVEYCEGGDLRRALSLDGQTVRGHVLAAQGATYVANLWVNDMILRVKASGLLTWR